MMQLIEIPLLAGGEKSPMCALQLGGSAALALYAVSRPIFANGSSLWALDAN